MANKQANELVTVSGVLKNDDYMLVYDTSESGSEKLKKRPISDYVATINSNLTLYVASNGSDTTGDGTSSTPWATINKAVDWLSNKFIAADISVIIQLADGTYNSQEKVSVKSPVNDIKIIGNISTPTNVTLNFGSSHDGILVNKNTHLGIQGLKIVGSNKSEWKSGVWSRWGSTLYINSCIIDGWGYGVQSDNIGFVRVDVNVVNNCNIGVNISQLSAATLVNGDITNCSTAGILSKHNSNVVYSGMTFSGNGINTDTSSGGTITSY